MNNDNETSAPVCGPQGCDVHGAATAIASATKAVNPGSDLLVISDAICPWCFVAKRKMEAAIAQLALEGLHLNVRWMPFELNPDMPKGGMDRREYRSSKFGSWAASQSLDSEVADAGKSVGLTFRHDLMTRTPNTFNAHRLIWLAGKEGVQDAVVEGIFRAYFTEGRDVGDASVLREIASAAGIPRERARTFLAGDEGAAEVRHAIALVREARTTGVPTFILNGQTLFSGAQPAELMVAAIRRASLSSQPGAHHAR